MNAKLMQKNKAHMTAEKYTVMKSVEIERLIRKRYTISDELALLRQRDEKPEEFAAFNDYAEACKRTVDESLGIAAKENAEA